MRSALLVFLLSAAAVPACGSPTAAPQDPGCGNGVLEAAAGEQCDDGNAEDLDGCARGCTLEAFDLCEGVQPAPEGPLGLRVVASGLDQPVSAAAPPRDLRRLFIVEQEGVIRVLKDGALLTEPFLDIRNRVQAGGERGLLGLAFAPDFAASRVFYVYYTARGGRSQVLERFRAPGADRADPSSGEVLLAMDDPAANHNGGPIAFGPRDGLLYVGTGDGGGAGDRFNNGQNRGTLLGKMLRLDVSSGPGYRIPASNPFVGDNEARSEIWAFGLRNPWRFSFDRESGDLYIGDVGQNAFEEVDFQPGASAGGENYGWPIVEGLGHCFRPASGCDQSGLVQPIVEISQAGGACSVIGGFVYRGCSLPRLRGTYFYSDYCSAFFRSFRTVAGQATERLDRTAELTEPTGPVRLVSSFAEDARGEHYVLSHEGTVYKLVAR